MKKILILICAALMLSSCSVIQDNINNINEGINAVKSLNPNSESDTAVIDEAEAVNNNINSDDYSVNFENAYYTASGGKNYILIEATFTNNSESNASFNQIYTLQAFQNGVGLIHTNNWNAGKYDMTAISASIQPNYSTKVYIGFEARSESTDISLECTPENGGNIITQNLNLTNITVETTTEAPTQPETVTVIVNQPSTPSASSSGGKYVCQGRTMEQAYALMSASEKAIVNNSSSSRELVNEQYAKHGYCFSKSQWHIYFYGYDH